MTVTGKSLYEKGLACEKAGDASGAFDAFRRSAKADPRVAAPYVGLSRILLRNHQRSEAIACLQQAVARESGNPAIHTLLGQALSQDGQLEYSQRSFEAALQLFPDSIDAVIGLAGVLEDRGDRIQAAATYKKLLERVPSNADCIAGLVTVAENNDLNLAIESARSQLRHCNNRDASVIGYALGKALARKGEHDAAFESWEIANAARQREAGCFDREAFEHRINSMIRIFSTGFLSERADWGNQSERPVFVVGLPRSGTTLTEQILASHPAVFGAGELDILTDLATGTPDRLGRAHPPWPETALELTKDHVRELATEHLSRLADLASPDAVRIIDKQPLNFWHIGLVALAFPNARIIHCRRDIRDNGLSIFAENFTQEQRWATSLTDIACYWHGYRRLMDHWIKSTGLRVLNVNYEETVTDIEIQSRRLTKFLGLSWEASVLNFHEASRAVQTPSRWQVRQPLYSSSVGRWRNYERFVAPLREARKSILENDR